MLRTELKSKTEVYVNEIEEVGCGSRQGELLDLVIEVCREGHRCISSELPTSRVND